MKLTIPLAACAALALAACGAPADDEAPVADETPTAADQVATPAPASAQEDTDTDAIPIALRGRWGLVPADCTSTRGDAKGLIDISADRVKFYESVATLGEIERRAPDSIRADWSFTGEGMTWARDMELTVQNGGNRLERREYGADALADPLTYSKCG